MGPQRPDNNADQRATSSTTGKLYTTSDGAPEHDAKTPSSHVPKDEAFTLGPLQQECSASP
jgi:hypothetical protein